MERETVHPVAADSLSRYLRDIRAYPLLTRAEEIVLARRARTGDAAALDRLVCSNLRFVVSIAKRYQHQGVLLPDLISEGNLGLVRAAPKFDETKGVKFISYAVWWVRQAVVQAIAEHGHAVRIPMSQAAVIHRVGRHANALRQQLGREPTREEISSGLDVSDAIVTAAIPISRAPASLDAPVGENEAMKLLDYLADEDGLPADRATVATNLEDAVETAMRELRPREAMVLRRYFGFSGEKPMTLEAIAETMGITRERVRQIKDKALSRLRKSKGGPVLASLRDQ